MMLRGQVTVSGVAWEYFYRDIHSIGDFRAFIFLYLGHIPIIRS